MGHYLGQRLNSTSSPPRKRVKISSIDDSIDELVNPGRAATAKKDLDEFDHWMLYEPNYQKDDAQVIDPIAYWLRLSSRYPHLSKFAIDVLSIPASSCECERMFSETGDLLEPRRRHMSPQLISAITCVRNWLKAGFGRFATLDESTELSEDVIDRAYALREWDL